MLSIRSRQLPALFFILFSLHQVVGVAQAINKKSGIGGTFTEQDEKVFIIGGLCVCVCVL